MSKTKLKVWNERFTCREDVVGEFTGDRSKEILKKYPKPTEVLYAFYEYENYSGSAFVLWRKGRKYYTLHGSHCSCYGLEESGFNPDIWSKKELLGYLKKANYIYGMDDEMKKLLIKKLERKPRAKKVSVPKSAATG